jgi:superfamily II DNA or RNA helicase
MKRHLPVTVPEGESVPAPRTFGRDDLLRWHQLDLLRRVLPPDPELVDSQKAEGQGGGGSGDGAGASGAGREAAQLEPGLVPYPWQKKALKAWYAADRKGILKVVTGAGKTVLALLAIRDHLAGSDEARVSVVVPTKVLLEQWHQELTRTLGLDTAWIGRRSGDYKDDFGGGVRVMVLVINSAVNDIGKGAPEGELRDHHLLIVDECHRAATPTFSRIFEVPRAASLGLSATPERDNAEGEGTDADQLPKELRDEIGEVVHELSFAEALADGILPPFELIHCGITLEMEERARYSLISRRISERRKELAATLGLAPGGLSFPRLQALAGKGGHPAANLAAGFVADIASRKELLYRAANRTACVLELIREEREGADLRIMLFHERIEQVNALFTDLVDGGFPATLEHTGLTGTQRDRSLELYLEGVAPILVSVRALVEGVNAPATDVGIIMAASASPRQKIQSMGRVMRRYPGKEGSRIYNLYIRDSVDEAIFRRTDFEGMLGAERVEYRGWSRASGWEVLDGPPFRPLPRDDELDPDALVLGAPYPGRDEGDDLSLDGAGTVTRHLPSEGRGASRREVLELPPGWGTQLVELKGGGGRVRLTPRSGHLVVPVQGDEGEWELLFGGAVSMPPRWIPADRDDTVTLSVTQASGGGLRFKRGTTEYTDTQSPAAKEILRLLQLHLQRPDDEASSSAPAALPTKVMLDASGKVGVRSEGRIVIVGTVGPALEWPFKRTSFHELKEMVHGDESG